MFLSKLPRKYAGLCSPEHAHVFRRKHVGTILLSPCIHLPPNRCLISEFGQDIVKLITEATRWCVELLGPRIENIINLGEAYRAQI